MEKKKIWMIALLVLGFGMMAYDKLSTPPTIQGNWDISQQILDNGYSQYLVVEPDFDWDNPEIYRLAGEIKQRTNSPEEAIKETITYVVKNVQYSSKVSVEYCYDEKASTVLEAGFGDCVSMARLALALLRAQGIPARTMGGCLSFSSRCTPLFSIYPKVDAMVTPMTMGDFKKRGFLHEWVEVWTPNENWRIIEATSGQIFPLTCNAYIPYAYDYNSYDRCVIQDQQFWDLCSQNQ